MRALVAKLARKRPSPLLRGDLRIWAAATIYTVGSVNFLFDRSQPLHLSGDDLSDLTGVPKSTMATSPNRSATCSASVAWTSNSAAVT